jgi:hypothetical protein
MTSVKAMHRLPSRRLPRSMIVVENGTLPKRSGGDFPSLRQHFTDATAMQ